MRKFLGFSLTSAVVIVSWVSIYFGSRSTPSPTEEQPEERVVARQREAIGFTLRGVKRGDFVVMEDEGELLRVQMVYHNWQDGRLDFVRPYRSLNNWNIDIQNAARWVKEVVKQDDPRWPEYRDRFLFGKVVGTTTQKAEE